MRFTKLSRSHDRKSFDCGIEMFNAFLKQYASQDIRRRQNSCFVLEGDDGREIVGFYTLCPHSIDAQLLPEESVGKRKQIPVFLLGMLAVDTKYQRDPDKHYGTALVIDAISRCQASEILGVGLYVEAKVSSLMDFYIGLGFKQFAPNKAFFRFPPVKFI